MKSKGLFLVAIFVLGTMACNNNQNQPAGFNSGEIFWTDNQGSAFNGAFGWNDNGVTTALFSGTNCDNLENSVDIFGGFSSDPCRFNLTGDGSPFTGTIAGTVCNATSNTETSHTLTCDAGFVDDRTQTIDFMPVIVFYASSVTDGNIGGRSGADALCVSSKPSSVTQANVRALISVSASDEIRDMPGNYNVPTDLAIVGTNDVVIGNNWADILDDSLANAPTAAGIPSSSIWTGSTSDGSMYPSQNQCLGWTSADNMDSGQIGNALANDGSYLGGTPPGSFSSVCGNPLPLYCIAFD